LKDKSYQLTIFADGGARGNPGPAAAGFVITDSDGRILKQAGEYLGETTNNVAEYQGVVLALKWVKKNIDQKIDQINFFLDSKLVVNQLNGLFKVKNGGLRDLIVQVRQLEKGVGGNVSYRHLSREKNQKADALVNQTLDKQVA
jgi:ribonuclease HI